MRQQDLTDYQRVEKAIAFITHNFKRQPGLNEVAEHLGLSAFHFQRLFSDWAGVSPKKFLQFISVEYAKRVLMGGTATLFDVSEETGLSGTGRLHDLFVSIESMTPGEYKNKGEGLVMNYSITNTLFGKVFAASTNRGLCKLLFTDTESEIPEDFLTEFSRAKLVPGLDDYQANALAIFSKDWTQLKDIKLHLKGTDFQLKVWQSLLQIPFGSLSSYGGIAEAIQAPMASRAVGTAIGSNPIACLIPCHRVVQATGRYGEYRWGSVRKKLLIGWEASQVCREKE